ncbi:MAG: diguanylate cyclase/phosphodiesterase with sensor(s), partial [Acidimicrobiales bacterium]|nr:diguanylate cyclase/phosphodiesterase with sensor(s) [Acidimicrobiales bacterium]
MEHAEWKASTACPAGRPTTADLPATVTARAEIDDAGDLAAIIDISSDLTACRSAEERAWRLSAVIDSSSDAVMTVDVDRVITDWNRGAEALYGYTAQEAVGKHMRFMIPPDQAAELASLHERILAGEAVSGIETVRLRKDGALVEVSINVSPVLDRAGAIVGISAIAHDITEHAALRRETQAQLQQLRDAETRLRLSFEQASIGAATADLWGRYTKVNPALCALFGRTEEELLGHSGEEFVAPGDSSHVRTPGARMLAGQLDSHRVERRFVRPDGEVIVAIVDVVLVRDPVGQPQYFFAQAQDVTARKRAEDALERLALHDPLTQLPNRLLLVDRLEGAVARARRNDTRVAVMFIDVDRFKLVNDSLGHVAGDRLIVNLADRFLTVTYAGDTVARFGGDEFVVVREDIQPDALATFGDDYARQLAEPFNLDGQEVFISASFGIALVDPDGSAETALREADTAMYRAKALGRDRVEIYSEVLRRESSRRLRDETDLRHALQHDQFRLVYQPIVRIASGEVVGVEALLRWDHPVKGEIGPDDFIPLTEDTGLIVPIGAWVLGEALRQLAAWRERVACAKDLWVSVNVSSRQIIDGSFLATARQALADSGLPAGSVHLELTETALMEDLTAAAAMLQGLERAGFRLSIDDFGRGYSSLTYLKQFPVDTIKIDRSF